MSVNFTPFARLGAGDTAAAWGDYNNDGYADALVGAVLFRNNNGSSFSHITTLGNDGGKGFWGDYDNDGFLDVFLPGGDKLFHNNNGTGSFTQVSFPNLGPHESRGATWIDIENDGDLDLYIGKYADGSTEYWPDAIVGNNGDGSFIQIWSQPNDTSVTPGQPRPARGVTTLDYNEDGWQDIFVSNYRLEPNALWENNTDTTFADMGITKGVAGDPGSQYPYGHTVGSSVGDIDNDGHIDIFHGNFRHNWGDGSQDHAAFFRNLGPAGNFAFQERFRLDGSDWQESYVSSALGDYDNDSDLDLFLTTWYGGDAPRLYENRGNWNFTDVTATANLSGLGATYQAAWADFDNDGDLDLITDGQVFQNNSTPGNYLKVSVIGDPAQNIALSPVGTIIRLSVNGETITRQTEGATGEGNQNDLTLHFGLGNYSGPINAEVFFPGGLVQNYTLHSNQTAVVRPMEVASLQNIGEVGQIDHLTDVAQTIVLQNTFQHPVVFTGEASYNGLHPVSVDVSNVQADRFTIQLTEPPNENGQHSAEQVTYIVLEQGNWTLPNGKRLEVGTVLTDATVGQFVTDTWKDVSLSSGFQSNPLIMTEVQTKNDASYVNTRQKGSNVSGFKLALEQEEAATTAHGAVETVGYLALEPGVGNWSGMTYEAGVSSGSNSSAVGYWDAAQPGANPLTTWEDLSPSGYDFANTDSIQLVDGAGNMDYFAFGADQRMDGIGNESLFDFETDRADPDNPAGTPFSINAYVKHNWSFDYGRANIVSKTIAPEPGSGQFTGWTFAASPDDAKRFELNMQPGNNVDRTFSRTNAGQENNQLQMVTLTHDGNGSTSGFHWYVNGALVNNAPVSNDLNASILTDQQLVLGRTDSGGPPGRQGFRGEIHFVEVYDEELSAAEVATR